MGYRQELGQADVVDCGGLRCAWLWALERALEYQQMSGVWTLGGEPHLTVEGGKEWDVGVELFSCIFIGFVIWGHKVDPITLQVLPT